MMLHLRRRLPSPLVAPALPVFSRPPLLLSRWRPVTSEQSDTLASAIPSRRPLHTTWHPWAIKPFLLADIGEGITEVQIIQWFVQEGAHINQFDKLCEVQSDKAAVEITSRFDGVIKRLHYSADDMAIVGKPLVDIDMAADDPTSASQELASNNNGSNADISQPQTSQTERPVEEPVAETRVLPDSRTPPTDSAHSAPPPNPSPLAVPAVRHLTKELGVHLSQITGTGKDGRITKEDVKKFAAARHAQTAQSSSDPTAKSPPADSVVPMTPVQMQMFNTMTRSLTIPHFLYTDAVDLTALTSLRHSLNTSRSSINAPKVSALAFILKAVSIVMHDFPILNARLDTTNAQKPALHLRSAHNIGIAVDTPSGLIVPVIRDVASLSIFEIAAEANRLASQARAGKLTSADLTSGTFTVSNVGSIGGMAVAPVIVEAQVAIIGIGRARVVPAFGEAGELMKREECVVSWSADHRVIDGATIARAAEEVRRLIEAPAEMMVRMR